MIVHLASIRRATLVFGMVLSSLGAADRARADPPGEAAGLPMDEPPRATAPSGAGAGASGQNASAGSAAGSSPTQAQTGLVVVALPGATDAAWPLARAVYAEPTLRPGSVDETHARILCGEPPPAGAPQELRDLSDTVAAIRGEDAPSRALLGDLARRFSVRGVVVVRLDTGGASARVFLPEAGVLDAATFAPDGASSPVTWSAATSSLVRTFGAPKLHAPPLASHPVETPEPPRAFYRSGWFWGALGAAAIAGGAVFLATRDNGPSTIHLQMEVPH